MKKNEFYITFLAFSMYFLTGAACIVIGSSLPNLVRFYKMQLNQVVLLSSSFAIGRVITVYQTGRLVEKIGPIKVLRLGVILISIFLVGLPNIDNFYCGILFALIGGIGMGAQDTVCPVLLSRTFKYNYEGALSLGQAMFGLGSFATPFLIGILIARKKPFYYAYYIISIVSFFIIVCSIFTKWGNIKKNSKLETDVKPLYVRNIVLGYITICLACIAYCSSVNTINLYTVSFAENMGISSSLAAFLLTTYNMGCVIGALIFSFILSKVKSWNILIINTLSSILILLFAFWINKVSVYFVSLFIAGIFLGVLFSIILAIATRIGYKRVSISSSLVATIGGVADITIPFITGYLVKKISIVVSFPFAIIMIGITLMSAIILKINIK